jgi:ribosome-binding protein aMBF1 (putative translation factor)
MSSQCVLCLKPWHGSGLWIEKVKAFVDVCEHCHRRIGKEGMTELDSKRLAEVVDYHMKRIEQLQRMSAKAKS